MVTKTKTCSWCDLKVYPGKGKEFVAKDGKVFFFASRKAEKFWHNKTKAVKLTWTTAWRRYNKKGTKGDIKKRRRTKKTVRVHKAIVGMSLDEINRRKDKSSDLRKKLREEARKEVQERRKKQIEKKRAAPKSNKAKNQQTQNYQKKGKALKGQGGR